jgi:pseudouridine kinase
VGADPLGDELLGATAAAGVDIEHSLRVDLPTGIYAATLQPTGELAVAVADMSVTAALGPEVVEGTGDLIPGATLLVLDANLRADTVQAALERVHSHGVPVVLDPVSVPKAAALSEVLSGRRLVHTLTPNVAELGALAGTPEPSGSDDVETAARSLLRRGVARVWVKLGAEGSLLVGADTSPVRLGGSRVDVVDVSGAGDAMLAAYCHALLEGCSAVEAAWFGQAAAALTVGVPETVHPELTADLVAGTLEGIP